jgi:hypothetical protein
LRVVAEMPRLPGGKIDYARIIAAGGKQKRGHAVPPAGAAAAFATVFSRRFVRQYFVEFADVLGIRARKWRSVGHIYQTLLATSSVEESDTFKSLAGDSLSYVQVSAALSDYVGALPADWPGLTVRELEVARLAKYGASL